MTHVHTYSSYSCQLAHACTICPHAQVSALLTSSCCNLISLTEELADFEVGSLTPEVEEDETLTSTHTPHKESSLLQCPFLCSPFS